MSQQRPGSSKRSIGPARLPRPDLAGVTTSDYSMIETPLRRSSKPKVEDNDDADFDTQPGSPEPKKGWLGNITVLFG